MILSFRGSPRKQCRSIECGKLRWRAHLEKADDEREDVAHEEDEDDDHQHRRHPDLALLHARQLRPLRVRPPKGRQFKGYLTFKGAFPTLQLQQEACHTAQTPKAK